MSLYHRSAIVFTFYKPFSISRTILLCNSAYGNGFLKAKHPTVSFSLDSVFQRSFSCHFLPGNSAQVKRKMSDYHDKKPSLNKFHTDVSKYAAIQKDRAKSLSMSFKEKMEKCRIRGKPLRLKDIQTWAELSSSSKRHAKKIRSSPADLTDKVSLWQGDITRLAIGAICNAANKSLLGGGGVDGAIHRAAGNRLYRECQSLCGCNTGEAKMTAGYLLPASYVIHTVGPIAHYSSRGIEQETRQLISCYKSCLNVVLEHNRTQRQRQAERLSRQTKEASEKERKESSNEGTKNTSEADVGEETKQDGGKEEPSATVSKEETSGTNSTEDQGSAKQKDSKEEIKSTGVDESSDMDVDAAGTEEGKGQGDGEKEVVSAKGESSSTESAGEEKPELEGKTGSGEGKSDKEESMDVESSERKEDDESGKDEAPARSQKKVASEESHPAAADIHPPEPLIDSIAFPCISTGIYGFPQKEAAEVALSVCRSWLEENPDEIERIIFCVFLDSDYDIYKKLLPKYFPPKGYDEEGDTSSTSQDEDNEEKKTDSPKQGKKPKPHQETSV